MTTISVSNDWRISAQKRVLIYDASNSSLLGRAWVIGSYLLSPAFDRVIAAKSVSDFFAALTTIQGAEHVQVWGHGGPGAPAIDHQAISPNDGRWLNLSGAEIWFRSCSVLQGADGHWFARCLSRFDLSVAGHLCVIGTWGMHSKLVGVRPGQSPWWSIDEGVGMASAPWHKRTVSALRMSLPDWTWTP